MWKPNRRQWPVLWIVAVAFVLFWPTGGERTLGVKAVNFVADPAGQLPIMPPPLPMELGDDGYAVARHDELERTYRQAYRSSWVTRTRIRLRDLRDPFRPTTEKQVVLAIIVFGGLLIWRLDSPASTGTDSGTGTDTDAGTG